MIHSHFCLMSARDWDSGAVQIYSVVKEDLWMPRQHLRAPFSDSSSRGALETSPLYTEVALADPVEHPLQAPPFSRKIPEAD